MQSVKALRRWLVIVALLRLLAGMESVCLGTCDVNRDAQYSAYDIVATCTDMLSAVFLGYFDHTKFKTNLFDDAPQEGGLSDCYAVLDPFMHAIMNCCYTQLLLVLHVAVTELCGRVFGIWTLLTCALCCICARNPCVPSIYGRLQQPKIGCLTLRTSVLTMVTTGVAVQLQSMYHPHLACRSDSFLICSCSLLLSAGAVCVSDSWLEECTATPHCCW